MIENKITYSIDSFVKVAKSVCSQVGGIWMGNHYHIPEDYGTGIAEAYAFDYFSVMYTQYESKFPVIIEREPNDLQGHLIFDLVLYENANEFEVQSNKQVNKLVPGCYVSTPNTASVGVFSPGNSHELLSILIDVDWLVSQISTESLSIVDDTNAPIFTYFPLDAHLIATIQSLHLSKPRSEMRSSYLKAKALEIVAYTTELLLNKSKLNHDSQFYPHELYCIQQLDEYLRTNLQNNPTVHDLSLKFGINRNRLQKLSKSILGNTISAHIRQLKMGEAYKMIESGYTVHEVGREMGYSNISHFARAFKFVHGVNPSTVKKSGRQN